MADPITTSDLHTREEAIEAFEAALIANPHAIAIRLSQLWEAAPREMRSRLDVTRAEARAITGVMNDVLYLGRPTDVLLRESFD